MKPFRVALALVALLLGASALAFGSVEYWASEWVRFGILAAFAVVVWNLPLPRWLSREERLLVAPIALIVVFALLQTVPLPRALARVVAPSLAAVRDKTVPPGGGTGLPGWLLSRAGEKGFTVDPAARVAPGPPDAGGAAASCLSVNPQATRSAALGWVTALLFFVVVRRLAMDPVRRYRVLWVVAAWGGVLGLVGVLQRVTGSSKLLWLRDSPAGATVLGPFVNPNHFAGWVEMALLATVGLLVAHLADLDGRVSIGSVRSAIADREWALPRVIALGLLTVLGLSGFVLAGSRAGWLALLAGILFLLPLRGLRSWLPVATLVVALAGLAVGLAAWVGSENRGLKTAIFVGTARDPSLSMRSDIWGRTLQIVRDHPVTGTGLGTFPWAYSLYDRPGEWQRTEQAHNDYLQLASETGVVGIAALLWALWVLAANVLRPAMRSDRGGGPLWTSVGCTAAVFAMLVHSIFDFGLQVPAVAVLFASLLGIVAAAARTGAHPVRSETA